MKIHFFSIHVGHILTLKEKKRKTREISDTVTFPPAFVYLPSFGYFRYYILANTIRCRMELSFELYQLATRNSFSISQYEIYGSRFGGGKSFWRKCGNKNEKQDFYDRTAFLYFLADFKTNYTNTCRIKFDIEWNFIFDTFNPFSYSKTTKNQNTGNVLYSDVFVCFLFSPLIFVILFVITYWKNPKDAKLKSLSNNINLLREIPSRCHSTNNTVAVLEFGKSVWKRWGSKNEIQDFYGRTAFLYFWADFKINYTNTCRIKFHNEWYFIFGTFSPFSYSKTTKKQNTGNLWYSDVFFCFFYLPLFFYPFRYNKLKKNKRCGIEFSFEWYELVTIHSFSILHYGQYRGISKGKKRLKRKKSAFELNLFCIWYLPSK